MGDMSAPDMVGRTSLQILQHARQSVGEWLGGPRGQLLVSPTVPAASLYDSTRDPIDLLFVDADHSLEGAARDLAAWVPHVRPGAVVVGHDYHPIFPGVLEAVNAALPRDTVLHLGPDMV